MIRDRPWPLSVAALLACGGLPNGRATMTLVALVVLSAGLACSPTRAGLGAACATRAECEGTLACVSGACRAVCVLHRECAATEECQPTIEGYRVCTGAACTSDAECGTSWACALGVCRARCGSVADCPADGVCAAIEGSHACARAEIDAGPPFDAGRDAAPADAPAPDAPDTSDPCFGRLDCDGDPSDCETEVLSDPAHCGSCTRVCADAPQGSGTCVLGACALACAASFRDCDGDLSNGCETETALDPLACGACSVACPAARPACARGECFPLPFRSTGADGAFHATADVVLAAGRYDFTTFTIDAGVTVTTASNGELDIRASGDVVVNGALDASGGRGGALSESSCALGGANSGGGESADVTGVGVASIDNVATCRGGGRGGSGAAGLSAAGCGEGGAYGGGAGGGRQHAGGGGGGYAGGGGGANLFTTGGPGLRVGGGGGASAGGAGGTGGAALGAGGGGGESSAAAPLRGLAAPVSSCGPGGGGGGSIGAPAAVDLRIETHFRAGSGGGGGGGTECGGGGGGGGGGGAIRIASATSIRIGPSGVMRADGGAGGGATGTTSGLGGGGGGSGGAIYLSSPILRVEGNVSAAGGAGGPSDCASSAGGAGGMGRVRLSVLSDRCELLGTSSHAWSGCDPTPEPGVPGSVFVDEYPF